jgi:hypothetical protein
VRWNSEEGSGRAIVKGGKLKLWEIRDTKGLDYIWLYDTQLDVH